MQESLYFIAVLPDVALRDAVKRLKEDISNEFATKHALKSPAHITIQRPFKRASSFEQKLMTELNTFASRQTSFEVLLKGYGAFQPKVLYLGVADHKPFEKIHADLIPILRDNLGFAESELSHSIHPHMTLAHRDLTPENFHRAWNKFKNYKFEAEFIAKSICLLKHNGKAWEVCREFNFGK